MQTKLKKPSFEGRTLAQIRHHYEIEKALASRLKNSTAKEDRTIIYRTMYDDLFKSVPDHPRLNTFQNQQSAKTANARKLRLIEPFLNKTTTLVEFGPGDCSFLMSVCDRVKFAYGVDISDQKKQLSRIPDNFEHIVYDGYQLNIKHASADVVFSDQLIEHLHPEDVELHFQLIRNILKPQGVYVFRTPHRFTGPHDVSAYFSDSPQGFHLREWTYIEISEILTSSKYLTWWGYWSPRGPCLKLPFRYFTTVERTLGTLPKELKKALSKVFLPSVIAVAVK